MSLEERGGKDLTVSCSNYNLESLDFRDGAENSFSMSNSWYIIVMGIIAGVLIAVLIVIFLWRCVCRRSHANTDEYAVICTDIKALYIKRDSTTNNLSHNGDESTDTWLNSSNIYFEVEPNYEMPQSSSGNIRNFQSAEDNNQNYYLDRKDSTDVQTTSPQENVYSHLREPSNMNTMTNLYDTIHCDEYSTLQRMKPTTVIDNTYNL
uniref:Uncharacterized protein n=1 Tax=Arion vulgaris TaxID=1028688 RepID=A0A0B7BNW7_9EUPU